MHFGILVKAVINTPRPLLPCKIEPADLLNQHCIQTVLLNFTSSPGTQVQDIRGMTSACLLPILSSPSKFGNSPYGDKPEIIVIDDHKVQRPCKEYNLLPCL